MTNPITEIERHYRELDDMCRAHCATHPRDAAIRAHLLNLESGFGWGAPLADRPVLFEMSQDPDTHQVAHREADLLMTVLDQICARNGGNVGDALIYIARFYEMGSDLVRGPDGHIPGVGRTDLYPGFLARMTVLGWGIVTEAWMVSRPRSAANPKGSLADEPDRISIRSAMLVDRYGAMWTTTRIEGGSDEALCFRIDPDRADAQYGGNVMHGLARLTQSIVGPAVPIPGDGPDMRRAAAAGTDPSDDLGAQ